MLQNLNHIHICLEVLAGKMPNLLILPILMRNQGRVNIQIKYFPFECGDCCTL